jgi:glycosyltransferase involved in cell wall biosynthesis
MLRVLRIINRFNLGGPTYNAAYLTKYLSPDFKTLLIGGQKDESEDSSEFIVRSLGIRPIIIPEMRREINPKNDIIAYQKLKTIIKRFKPDIVHTHASKAGTLGRLAAFNSNVPVVLHTFHGHVFHSYFNSYKAKAFKSIEQNLAKKSSRIIAISEKQKYELSEVYKIAQADKIEVIPLGFDLSRFQCDMENKRIRFRTEYMLENDELAIGIIGRLVPIKNHKFFLNVVKSVIQNTTVKLRFFVVGDGECRQELEMKAKELEIDFTDFTQQQRKATITFTSWIKEVDYVYAGLDIVTLTSLNEGTPVSLIEAQAANKPIVSTNTGGIENVIIPDVTAFLTEVNDEELFAKKLLELISSENLRLKMGNNGWNQVGQKYHYERLTSDMKALYHKLLSN